VFWLGERRGDLADWTTQQWVRATGRQINFSDHRWLDGPVGDPTRIGKDFFEGLAKSRRLELKCDRPRGLLQNFDDLCLDTRAVASCVRDFYERTSEYELDVWSEWRGTFRPFGRALAVLFSRRLQQLNVPLSALDTSRGLASSVTQVCDPNSGAVLHTAWVRELHATKNVLYAGSYSVSRVPGHAAPCVKVVFPLPHGNGIVFMKAEPYPDGSLILTSAGKRFGDPGFYFTVHDRNGSGWARYVRSLQETIHVYAAESGAVRTDHVLWIWGFEFLRLHYRMRVI